MQHGGFIRARIRKSGDMIRDQVRILYLLFLWSPLVKHLCKIRNKNITKGVTSDLQKRIDELIRENLVRAV